MTTDPFRRLRDTLQTLPALFDTLEPWEFEEALNLLHNTVQQVKWQLEVSVYGFS